MSKTTEHGTYSYGYDGASRLTSAGNPTLGDESYSYDAVGNRTGASNAAGSITHNANNELTMYGDVDYEYDANGNMTKVLLSGQMMFQYHYNADNRLVKVEGGNNTTIAEYYHDPFGRRLWKEVGGERTYFFYADEGLVAEYDASGNEIRSYGYKPDSTWTTDPLWLKQGDNYYFYQNDHLGTPQKLVAQNGAVVWLAKYNSFGRAQVEVDTVTNNLRFPGQYFDVETGLHYNWHRYYEPGIGRYVSADPIGFGGGGVNWYEYVGSNPVNAIDSYGLLSEESKSLLEKLPPIDEHSSLAEIEAVAQTLIAIARREGYHVAADNFEHYLNGSGVPQVLSADWLRNFPLVKDAERRTQEYHENALVKIAKQMRKGETKYYSDYWEGTIRYPFSADPEELFWAAANSVVTAYGGFTLKRGDSCEIDIDGFVIYVWSDYYDFEAIAKVYIPEYGFLPDAALLRLAAQGTAKGFAMNAEWKQRLSGKVTLRFFELIATAEWTWNDL